MYYMEMSMWLQNAINTLQEPTRTVVILLLCVCVPPLLAFLVWLANRQEEKNQFNN